MSAIIGAVYVFTALSGLAALAATIWHNLFHRKAR